MGVLLEVARDRTLMVANIAALVIAVIVALEGIYIVHALWGIYRIFDGPGSFVPALAMFIVRKKGLSLCFLFLYVALALQMFHEASVIYRGVWHPVFIKEPNGYLALFIILSLAAMVIYFVVVLISAAVHWIQRLSRSKNGLPEQWE